MPALKAAAALGLAGAFLVLALALPLYTGEDGLRALDTDRVARANLPAPPTLLLLSPEEGQGVAASIPVRGEARAEKTVLDVQYRLDGASWASIPRVVGGARVVPFAADVPVPVGDHLLEVRAYDGESFSLVARAFVRAALPDAPPTARILAPLDGQGLAEGLAVVRGTVASATPTRVYVTAGGREVEATMSHLAGGVAAWTATVDLPAGTHTIAARGAGGLPRAIHVAAAPSAPPTLRILAPREGAAFGSAGDPACPAACLLFAGEAPGATDVLVSLDGAPPTALSHEAPGTYTRDVAGAWTFALPTARLLSGEHTATFSPVGAEGAQGAPQTVRFTLRALPGVRIAGDEAPRLTHTPLRFALEGERIADARWLLDGKEAGTGTDVEVRLATPGAHALTLHARDDQGRAATASVTLHALNQAPVATLVVPDAPLSGAVTLAAHGQDTDGRVVSYRWDLGDGTTRMTQGNTTTHAYGRSGAFRVNVTPVDDRGAEGFPATGFVIVLNAGPVPAFSWTPANPTLLETVTFTDASADPEGPLASVRWSFGDGGTGQGRTVTHRFTSRGAHEVTLTARDAEGVSTSLTRTVVVANLPPSVAFVHEPAAVQTGAQVLFQDRTVKMDGALVAWSWDFGHDCAARCDAVHAREANGSSVLHAFPEPGKYAVRLTVTDDAGEQASRTLDVVVSDALPELRDVTVEPSQPNATQLIRFNAIAIDVEDRIAAIEWRFGDGATATGVEAWHAYARSGVYHASAWARDQAGQTVEHPFLVVVANAKPMARLDLPVSPVAGQVVALRADASDPDGHVVRYRFDADGDGVPECDGPAPRCLFTYPVAGTYVPTLAVADDEGASVLVDAPLDVRAPVGPRPAPLVDAPAPGQTLQGRVVLSGTAGGPQPIAKVEVQWRRGNATLSAAREPWMEATGNATWRLYVDTRAFPDGAYDLVVRATDTAGSTGLAQVPIVVSNGVRESLVGLTLHNVPAAPLRADVDLRGSAWHPEGPVSVRYQLDEGPWRDASGDAVGFTIPLSLRELGPGPHLLRVDARRGLADHREETVAFRVAGPPPALVVDEIPTPLAYGLLTASGRLVGEGRVQWRIDHDVWRDLPEGPAWRLALETAAMDGGTHAVWLRPVSQDGMDEGAAVRYYVRVINPSGMTDEDRRLLEDARKPTPEPGEVDLDELARTQQTPLGAWPVVLALILGVAVRLRRARL